MYPPDVLAPCSVLVLAQYDLFESTFKVLCQSRLARVSHHDLDQLSGHKPHEASLIGLHINKATEKTFHFYNTLFFHS